MHKVYGEKFLLHYFIYTLYETIFHTIVLLSAYYENISYFILNNSPESFVRISGMLPLLIIPDGYPEIVYMPSNPLKIKFL